MLRPPRKHIVPLALAALALSLAAAPALADHATRVCQTSGGHTYCVVLVPFTKLGDVTEPVNVGAPLYTVNAERWRMELHVSTTPGDPDASLPIAVAALNGNPIPADFNVSADAAGQRVWTTAAFHVNACVPHCAVVPTAAPGAKLAELWLSYVQLTEDGFVVASTPPLPMLHLGSIWASDLDSTVGTPDPRFVTG